MAAVPRKGSKKESVYKMFDNGVQDVAKIATDCGVTQNTVRTWRRIYTKAKEAPQ